MGLTNWQIIWRHVLPNSASALIVQMTVAIPAAILSEAVLSYLGLGVQPPTPEWGTMLASARDYRSDIRARAAALGRDPDAIAAAIAAQIRRHEAGEVRHVHM